MLTFCLEQNKGLPVSITELYWTNRECHRYLWGLQLTAFLFHLSFYLVRLTWQFTTHYIGLCQMRPPGAYFIKLCATSKNSPAHSYWRKNTIQFHHLKLYIVQQICVLKFAWFVRRLPNAIRLKRLLQAHMVMESTPNGRTNSIKSN